MKILNCHIENFGKLHNFSIDFTEKENVICKENGWGKSTLAAFIRAMFYGLEGERKRSILENEVKRYKPWQGGVFGGKLTFEVDGKQYTVTRNFSDANGFELRDAKTNIISSDYSQKLGEELFGVNRESFMRTVFIGQNACETSSTDDINAKLGNLTDNTNDINNYEAANDILTKLLNNLNPNRTTGSISKRIGRITTLERIVQDGSGIEESIKGYQYNLQKESETYEKIKLEIDVTSELQKKVSGLQKVIAGRKEWEDIQADYQDKVEELNKVKRKFPGEVPGKGDVEAKLDTCVQIEDAKRRMHTFSVTEEENKELSQLEGVFENNVPEDLDIDSMIEKARYLTELRGQLKVSQMTEEESRNYDKLSNLFANDNESVATVSVKWNNRRVKSDSLGAKQATLAALKTSMLTGRQEKKKIPWLAILGVVAIIVGIFLAVVVSMLPGVMVIAVGTILLVVGLLTGKNNVEPEKQQISPEIEQLQKNIEEDKEYIRKIDEEVSAYLVSHGKTFDEPMVSFVLSELANDYYKYNELKNKLDRQRESKVQDSIDELKKTLDMYLWQYSADSEEEKYVESLYELRSKANRFVYLGDKKKELDKATLEYLDASNAINAFLDRFGYEHTTNYREVLTDIRDNIVEYKNKEAIYQEIFEKKEAFENTTDITSLIEIEGNEEVPTLEELSDKLKMLTNELETSHRTIVGYNGGLEELQEKYDEWEENKLALEEEKRLFSEEKEKYEHINLARNYLRMAKESMTMNYAKPILESFSKYYESITKDGADNIRIDANTVITVEEMGAQRETNTLSLGYRDLIGIALRVALVDVMYKDEVPVLIMDDPFVNLDDKKQKAARELLSSIANKYQVIYFTCSDSRS